MLYLLQKQRNKYKRTGIYKCLLIISVSMSISLPLLANATDTVSLLRPQKIESSSLDSLLQSSQEGSNKSSLSTYEANYIDEKCHAETFAKVVLVPREFPLWKAVDWIINKNSKWFSPDYWVTFNEGNTNINRYVIPWVPEDSEKRGVLFVLFKGVYDTQYIFDNFVSYKKNDLTGPRIGLCGAYDDTNDLPTINLVGSNIASDNSSKSDLSPRPPLHFSMAQLELYNLRIRADETDDDVASIGLANGARLLMEGVFFSRSGIDIQSSEVGLVDNYKSYVSIKSSQLQQYTNTGTAIHTTQGVVNCEEESQISITQYANIFKGFSNEISLRDCHFNSQTGAILKSTPVFFYDNFDEASMSGCTVKRYSYCKKFPDAKADDNKTCRQFTRICDKKVNVFDIRDNTFTGNWKNIFRSRWSSFPLQDSNRFSIDTNGVNAGSFKECADKGSFSIYGNFLFDSERCVNRVILK